MQRLRDQLLARAALAAHEHGEVRLGDLADRLEDALHRRARADQVLEGVLALHALEQLAVLARHARALERALHDQADLLVVERLRDVVLRARLHRLDRDLLGAVRGDHHHHGLGAQALGLAQHVETGGPVAEREVGQHEVEALLGQPRERLVARAGEQHLVAGAAEQPRERELDGALVFDDQDAGLHASASSSARWRGNTATNSAPPPGRAAASIVPPCASTSFFTIARPRPVPFAFDV